MRRRGALVLIALMALAIIGGVGLRQTSNVSAQGGDLTLYAGLNMVVYTGPTLDVEPALNNVVANVDSIWLWDATEQGWDSWFRVGPSFITSLTEMSTGSAYWMRTPVQVVWIFASADDSE